MSCKSLLPSIFGSGPIISKLSIFPPHFLRGGKSRNTEMKYKSLNRKNVWMKYIIYISRQYVRPMENCEYFYPWKLCCPTLPRPHPRPHDKEIPWLLNVHVFIGEHKNASIPNHRETRHGMWGYFQLGFLVKFRKRKLYRRLRISTCCRLMRKESRRRSQRHSDSVN